jgi:hypothetical protein
MTAPTFFTVVADYKSVVVDLASDVDADPQLGPITAKVTFTPVLAKGDVILATNASPRPTGYLGAPIVARIDADGRLKLRVEPDGDRDDFATTANFPATGTTAKVYYAINTQTFYRWNGSQYVETLPYAEVRLLADTPLLELDSDLYYRVSFSEVVFNGQSGYISPFVFQAPTADVELNLIEVTPVPGQPASGITKIAPGAVRAEDGNLIFSFGGVDLDEPVPYLDVDVTLDAADISDSTATGQALITAANAAAARAVLGTQQVFDVKAYGAVGNGTTDDRASIQAALDAAVAAGGGTVHLPRGTYKLTNKITLGSNITLQGEGPQSVLKPIYGSLSVNRVIDNDWVNGNSNIMLRDFKLDRSGANITHGMLFNGITNLLIEGVEISGRPAAASGCIAVSGIGPATRLLSKNVKVTNCYFADVGNYGVQVGFVDGCVMSNNVAFEADREVFGVEPEGVGSSSKNVAIIGNTIYGSLNVMGTSTGLIVVTESSLGSIFGVTVAGNTLRQAPGAGTGDQNPGILVLGGDAITVTGNSCHDMHGPGIQISNALLQTFGVVVQGNSVFNCGLTGSHAGIKLRNAYRCVVSGNHVVGASHTVGISEEASSANNLIFGNYLQDATPLSAAGSGSLIYGNKNADGDATMAVPSLQLGSTDTTLSRSAAGKLAVEGVDVLLNGGALGTPASGTLTNCTFPTLNQNTTGTAAGLSATLAVGSGGTGATTLTGLIKGTGTSAMVAATAGTDYVAPGGALGTPASGTLTNCTFPTLNQNTTGSAATLTTPRNINGVAFDGSANITVADSTKEPTITAGTTAQYYRGDKTFQTLDKTAVGLANVDDTSNVTERAATATLTNKTIQGTRETVHAITDGAAFEIDPANGGIQTITLGASRTPKATNFQSGHSMTLMVAATTDTITWTDATLNPTWIGGSPPSLSSTQQTVISLWEVGSTIYGSLIGYA